MNPWPFVAAAYGITILASGVLTAWAYGSMRRAELRAEELTRR